MARNPHASYEASDHQRMPIIPKFTDYIANNLTTTVAGFALDARQGKILNDTKLNIANVVNNLTTTVAGYALDARQGKTLDDKITSLNNSLSIKWPIKTQYCQAGANNTWHKIFTISYPRYNYLHLTFLFKCGYWSSGICFLRIRYNPSGVAESDSLCQIVSTKKDTSVLRVVKESTYSISVYLFGIGEYSFVGYDILDISSESQALSNMTYWTFYNHFPVTTTAPTASIATNWIS